MMKSFVVLILGIVISETFGGFSYRSRSSYNGAGASPLSTFRMTPRYRTSVSAGGISDGMRHQRIRSVRAAYPQPYLDRPHTYEDYILGRQVSGEPITCFEPGFTYNVFGHLPFDLPAPDAIVYSCTGVGVDPPPMPLQLSAALVEGYFYACPDSIDLSNRQNWVDGSIKTNCEFFFYDHEGRILESWKQPFIPLITPLITPYIPVEY